MAKQQESLLGGYRVLDLTDEGGLMCGKILGDLGADVIQIEPPGGCPARNIGPFYHDIPHPEKSLYWFWTALNKRGITLNLDTADGRETFRQLVKTADFVIESFKPGYMASLGLGYEELERINPRIIMTSITPFGQTGPYARYKTTDLVGVSMGGMSRIYGEVDRPVRVSSPQFYFHGGIQGALGSVMAHYHREMTGEGQYVDVSCQQAIVLTLGLAVEYWDIVKISTTGAGPGAGFMGRMVMKLIYPCKDGYVLTLIGGGSQAGFITSSKALVELANRDGYFLDFKDFDWPNFDFMPAAMGKAFGQETEGTKIIDRIQEGQEEFLPTKSKQELLDAAVEKAILLIPVCDPKDVAESPQLAAREFWVQVEHPELGETFTYPGYPIKIGGLPPYKPQRRAPLIGEHNEEVYGKEMGFSKEKLVIRKTDGKVQRKQILEGIKVADFSWVAVGPQVARELAEHGATVIRIECHRYPDALRTTMPYKDFQSGIDRSALWTAYNTNKYGLSVDLNTPKGQEIAKKLVAWADVVTDSMVPGTMAKWGLDYESCKKIKSDIIYYSTCQMGQKGPYAKLGGYGAIGTAYGGYSHLLGWPDGSPLPFVNNYTDLIAPWFLCTTLVLALLHRGKTGRGMYLDQSQIEAGINFLGPVILDYTANGRIANRMGNRDPYMAPHGIYPCQVENRYVAIAVSSEKEWEDFCRVLGNPEWTKDPRFYTLQSRKDNEEELDRLVGEWTKGFTAEQVMDMMQKAGVAAGVVQTTEDLFNDPQLKHREHFRFLEHKVIGTHAYNAPAYKLSKTPNYIWKAAPCLGEDNEYVYKEILGYTDDEIADLLVEGVITTDSDVPEVLR